MASLVSSSLGVPILLLREAEGHPITIGVHVARMALPLLRTTMASLSLLRIKPFVYYLSRRHPMLPVIF